MATLESLTPEDWAALRMPDELRVVTAAGRPEGSPPASAGRRPLPARDSRPAALSWAAEAQRVLNPRAIRGWLWRLNAVLALAVAAVGLKLALGPVAASPAPPDIPPRRACSPAEADGPFLLEEALRYLTRLHGPEPAESLDPSPPSSPVTPLPLGAYRALLWVRDPDGPDHVTLRSKDPARPESLLLIEGEARNGLLLAKVEEDGDVVRFHVHRGADRHTYEFRSGARTGRDLIREIPRPRGALGRRLGVPRVDPGGALPGPERRAAFA